LNTFLSNSFVSVDQCNTPSIKYTFNNNFNYFVIIIIVIDGLLALKYENIEDVIFYSLLIYSLVDPTKFKPATNWWRINCPTHRATPPENKFFADALMMSNRLENIRRYSFLW